MPIPDDGRTSRPVPNVTSGERPSRQRGDRPCAGLRLPRTTNQASGRPLRLPSELFEPRPARVATGADDDPSSRCRPAHNSSRSGLRGWCQDEQGEGDCDRGSELAQGGLPFMGPARWAESSTPCGPAVRVDAVRGGTRARRRCWGERGIGICTLYAPYASGRHGSRTRCALVSC